MIVLEIIMDPENNPVVENNLSHAMTYYKTNYRYTSLRKLEKSHGSGSEYEKFKFHDRRHFHVKIRITYMSN